MATYAGYYNATQTVYPLCHSDPEQSEGEESLFKVEEYQLKSKILPFGFAQDKLALLLRMTTCRSRDNCRQYIAC